MTDERFANEPEQVQGTEEREEETCNCTAKEEKTEPCAECPAQPLDETEQLRNELAVARADLYNYRQRVERDRIKTRKLIAEDKVCEFLPVLDNLDRALCVPETGTAKDVLIGVRMVQRQFLSVLEGSDVTVIPTEGVAFDPFMHDAVETEPVEDPALDGGIVCELLRGYKTSERVLRPAQVRVARLKI